MTETAQARTLVIEREMPHPPERIWRALTEGQLLEQWLMKNDFQPVVGHRFSFRAAPVANWSGVIECEVRVVEPNSRLSYGWGTLGLETLVTWTLTPTEGGTLLRMEQSGFGPDQTANYKGANYGWKNFIGNLERVLGGLV
ncbi:MAG: SRPBCC domain-containing protein [Terracidiphilus sp.]